MTPEQKQAIEALIKAGEALHDYLPCKCTDYGHECGNCSRRYDWREAKYHLQELLLKK